MEIFIFYFIVGTIHYIGWTIWYIFIESRKTISSGFLSATLTFIDYCVLAYMILSPDFIIRLIFYAMGCWFGTSIAIMITKNKSVQNYLQKV